MRELLVARISVRYLSPLRCLREERQLKERSTFSRNLYSAMF